MYLIAKRFDFSASHQLDLGEGHPCARIHGHNYTVEIILGAEDLDDKGMVLDYGKLAPFKEVVNGLDHRHLNDVLPVEPTAENIAHWLYSQAIELWPNLVFAIRVSETGKTWAEYAR